MQVLKDKIEGLQGVTRFATSYLTLRHFYETKIVLRVMFAFKEWQMSQYYRKVNDIKVRNIILTN